MKKAMKTNVGKSVANPKLVYYDKLIAFIKSEDVHNIHDFASEFCSVEDSEFEEPVHGSFRDFCSYMIVLADLSLQSCYWGGWCSIWKRR